MSGSLNRVTLIGNLGADPELRATQSGQRIATLSIATSERWTDRRTGEKQERTEWHRVVIFNEALAEIVEKHLKKGAKVMVEGKLITRKWEDRDGIDRYTTEIVLSGYQSQLIFLDSRKGNITAGGNHQTSAPPQGAEGNWDDQVPF